jgi:hypothetical protein
MNTHPNGVWIWNLSKIGNDYLEKLAESKIKRVYLKRAFEKSGSQ